MMSKNSSRMAKLKVEILWNDLNESYSPNIFLNTNIFFAREAVEAVQVLVFALNSRDTHNSSCNLVEDLMVWEPEKKTL